MHTDTAPGPGAIELKGDDEDPAAIVTKALDELKGTVEARLKEVETKAADATKLGERLDKLEAKANRPGTGETKAEPSVERKAFDLYLRRGANAPDLDTKALTVSVDTQGGYTAPAEFSAELVRNLVEVSPIRGIASVRTTSSPSVQYPKRTAGTNAAWRGEVADSTESDLTFGQTEIPVHELSTYVDVSNQLLADSAVDVEAEVRLALAEDFAKKEGLAFVSGDGVGKPLGILSADDVAYTANGHASNFSADALITMIYALPAMYRNRGTFVMNGATLAVLRKLKDGQGNFLWQPSYQLGQPETILGRPVVEAVDMPDATSGNFPVVFGDFNAAYRIVDRVQLSVLVNPYSRATNGITRFHATRRVGGAVIQAAAIRKLKMATS